ncbi:hypothetical protein GCM10027168_73430 [Streptomyces capparidis]
MSSISDIFNRAENMQKAVGSFYASLETLESFKKRIDDLITDLEKSKAAPNEISEGTLATGDFGTGFVEAEKLYGAYKPVHTKLKELSKTFADQIEAMRLLVGMANNDYRNVDEEQRDRLWEIRQKTERHWRDARRDESGGNTTDTGRPAPEESTSGGAL